MPPPSPSSVQVLVAGGLAGVAASLVLLALSHRWERRLLLVAGATMAWAGLLVLPPLAAPLQAALGLCLMVLLLRQAELRHPALDALLGLPVMAAVVVQGLDLDPWSSSAARILTWLLGVELLMVAAVFLWRRWRLWLRLGLETWGDVLVQIQHTVLPLLAATAVGGLLLHWDRQPRLPFSIAVLLAALGAGLLLEFARQRLRAEETVRRQDLAMAERLGEQARQHEILCDQRLEQVTQRERKRIASDLHDDLGAKLLTIVHTSDNERISTLAREALEEMRLSVRGLTGRPVQLMDALADWRAEVVSRLTQSNIEVEWLPPAEDLPNTLPARTFVQTTRIIREAVSNVIKHSGATRCVLRCAMLEEQFQIVIQDNGHGVSAEREGRLDRGHGMASMKSRAKQMQGQCLVESGPGLGTLIRLNIPI